MFSMSIMYCQHCTSLNALNHKVCKSQRDQDRASKAMGFNYGNLSGDSIAFLFPPNSKEKERDGKVIRNHAHIPGRACISTQSWPLHDYPESHAAPVLSHHRISQS